MINQLVKRKSSDFFQCDYIIIIKFKEIPQIYAENIFVRNRQSYWILQKINKKVYKISPKKFCYSKITRYLRSVITR